MNVGGAAGECLQRKRRKRDWLNRRRRKQVVSGRRWRVYHSFTHTAPRAALQTTPRPFRKLGVTFGAYVRHARFWHIRRQVWLRPPVIFRLVRQFQKKEFCF